jgi:phosphoribosylaminoimidazolecarboxamide formyltransferase/IMP cyclohydrolase
METLSEHGIVPIDLVAVNLYPFEATVSTPDCQFADALEQIDIGGPAMIRAAAKNHPSVVVVTNPSDYPEIVNRLRTGTLDQSMRRQLAAKAFAHVSTYDSLVAQYLNGEDVPYPAERTVPARLHSVLRYGENPHQTAAAYFVPSTRNQMEGILSARQLHGKELSYNNILDANAAFSAVAGLSAPAACVVKHTIPCGLAIGDELQSAYIRAFDGDQVSAFGGIVALNRPVDLRTAEAMADVFYEVVVAPGFSSEALQVLTQKKNLRLLDLPQSAWTTQPRLDLRSIVGGLLIQDGDSERDPESDWTTPTATRVPEALMDDIRLAWHASRFAKSNAIALVKGGAVVGIGPGQPNRVDSVRIALQRAGDRAAGAVLASDAFFPFADGVEVALAAGIAAVVQPGGSMRDGDVVAACDNIGVPMLFTGRRHFLH